MKGFEINFKVYADTQEEADAASKALQDFVNEGRAVTAQKLTECVPKWKDNLFVKNQIIKYFK